MTPRQKINNKRINAVLGAFLFPFFFFVAEYTYYRLSTRDTFFNYVSVNAIKPEFEIGEKLYFISEAQVFKTINFDWEDILKCDFEDDDKPNSYNYVQNFRSTRRNVSPNEGAVCDPVKYFEGDPTSNCIAWKYDEPIPVRPATCFVEANVCAELPHGVKHCQTLNSGTFKINSTEHLQFTPKPAEGVDF